MDATLSTLKACKHLSLSTNNIEKISSLSGMDNLTILSLGKNLIKKIENLDGIADTLEELWMSYNLVASLANVEKLTKLRILYMSNNKIDKFSELDKLGELSGEEESHGDTPDPMQLNSTANCVLRVTTCFFPFPPYTFSLHSRRVVTQTAA